MRCHNTASNYGAISKAVHWLLFAAVVFQYFAVYYRPYFPEGSAEHLQWILRHKSVGGLVLLVMPWVILWRLCNTYPTLHGVPRWQARAARTNQWVMTFLLFGMPLGGYIMTCASGRTLSIFGHALPSLIAPNKELANLCYQGHVWGSYLLLALVTFHVGAALYHTFWHKHRLIHRMLPAHATK